MRWVVFILISVIHLNCISTRSSKIRNSSGQNADVSYPIYHDDIANNPIFWYYWGNPNPVNLPRSSDPEDLQKMKEQEARRNIERNQNEEIKNTPSFQQHNHRNTVEPRLFN
jgi:hypothetical protein